MLQDKKLKIISISDDTKLNSKIFITSRKHIKKDNYDPKIGEQSENLKSASHMQMKKQTSTEKKKQNPLKLGQYQEYPDKRKHQMKHENKMYIRMVYKPKKEMIISMAFSL